ncbi:hypothetical protein GCM10027271_06830 [Saccharopolyspora gloriosae]|uniref:Putative T7SS secretion signal domain-containing protein n=1 Tax=Saccharopolyspora gloriosae TaxID=455344 RepID=A0A840NMB5_9PSEU|nr:hypothetical protein [Saccharopolyspora gloriosae]MBB5072231.1 hypothetical protein [Saccharopolyspora gloriosae]
MIQPPSDEPPLPGNAPGIVTECDRLRTLADHLDQTGRALRDVRVESWSGRARDRFDAAQYELSKRWRQSADAHYAAADALGEYQVTLENLQQLARSEAADAAGDPVRQAAAAELIRRWRMQQDEAGRRAARAILRAGEDLATLPPVLPEAAPPPPLRALPPPAPAAEPPRGAEPEPEPEPAHAPEPVEVPDAAPPLVLESLHPDTTAHDLHAYQRELLRLNEDVLAAWADPGRRFAIPIP